MKMKGDWQALVREARRKGWRVESSRGGHVVWESPDGRKVFSGLTPSDRRSLANHLRYMRKAGYVE